MFLNKVGQLLAVAAFTATVAGTAQAQNARDGFWFSGGLGYGTLGCNDCSGRTGSISGNLSLGGTISQRFLLGVGAIMLLMLLLVPAHERKGPAPAE